MAGQSDIASSEKEQMIKQQRESVKWKARILIGTFLHNMQQTVQSYQASKKKKKNAFAIALQSHTYQVAHRQKWLRNNN